MLGHLLDCVTLLFFLSLCWRYIFKVGALPQAGIAVKLLHAFVLVSVAAFFWGNMLFGLWIVEHPQQWVDAIFRGPRNYSPWVDVAFQLFESAISLPGLLVCYFTLEGKVWVRPWFLLILGSVYLCSCYEGLKVEATRRSTGLELFTLLLAAILALPFALAGAFYGFQSTSEKIYRASPY